MNKRLEGLMKISPFIAGLFILDGLIMGILSIFDHNVKLLTSSLLLIVQSILLLTYGKMFRKIWRKS
ncbi:hypothetical protein [Lederbergia panacisoli]|uniref:hypothetical protein n=1 Tax=Lederbergia panacisoli TaxID=1255251 RepID=UPI00214B300B|nr:hypothetical protein [Lederbergia panacisoli]MCR2822052.1 hypothetical protein [Lederbergia panacisoli]